MNDRLRIELLLFVDMLTHIVEAGAANRTDPHAVSARRALEAARTELTADVSDHEAMGKMLRRLYRVDRAVMVEHRRQGQTVASFGLAIFCVLRDLTDADYLVIPETGPMREAVNIILPGLAALASEPEHMEAAEQAGAEIIRGLQAEGYLQGFKPGRAGA